MALTDTALKALKAKQKAYVVSDDRSLAARQGSASTITSPAKPPRGPEQSHR